MATQALTQTIASLTLRASASVEQQEPEKIEEQSNQEELYRYAHLLPTFPDERFPPLEPYEHVDPGHRALAHPNPRSFLNSATSVIELTPDLGTEVRGLSLANLTREERDQLALEVSRRGLLVFRDQQDFIDRGPEFYLEWGRYFGRLHIHPTSGHPAGYPEFHLVYRDANSTFNFEIDNSITSTIWHSDSSPDLQPPGLTTFFLLAQPRTGGDTLFTSQVSTLKKLSPPFVAFLKTLKAIHSSDELVGFSRSGRRGGVVRREPVENVHPVVRRHPVTGEEVLYVNKQYTRRIVGLKKEESDNILNFLYNHIARSGDLQARVHWSPNTVILWDNRVTAHTAISDYGKELSKERRHGLRITAWDGLEL